ncbi:MAG: hypothetical protein AB1529_05725 [Candidatus Micrarchaeota archaeon]
MQTERRRHVSLRCAIDDSKPMQRRLLIAMARMLGPDGLATAEREAVDCYSDRRLLRQKIRSGMEPEKAGVAVRLSKLAPGELPKTVLDLTFVIFSLSDGTGAELEAAGIRTVGDFVPKGAEELRGRCLSGAAIEETGRKLFFYGIRSASFEPQ